MEFMGPEDRKELYIIINIIIGVVIVILTIVAGIVIDALDTAHEKVMNEITMQRLMVYERLVADTGVNPIAVECSLNPPIDRNTAFYALCTIATGAISDEQLSEIGRLLPNNVTLGE